MTEKEKPTLDCTDIKVMLSALVDDQVDADARYRAERHLAVCEACRTLVGEAERNDALVAATVGLGDQPQSLPAGFEAIVLDRARGGQRSTRRWTSWLGWFAAAAVLLLAATLWQLDRPAAVTGTADTDAPPALINAVYQPGLEIRSWMLDDEATRGRRLTPRSRSVWPVVNEVAEYVTDLSAMAGSEATTPVSSTAGRTVWWRLEAGPGALSRDDVEALEGASLLLAMLRQGDDDGFGSVEHARQIIEYDGLLDRLSDARANLSAEDRPPVLAAESVLYRVANGPLSLADVREMRRTISRLGLPQQIEAISGGRPDSASL
jgi:hypothetical protein